MDVDLNHHPALTFVPEDRLLLSASRPVLRERDLAAIADALVTDLDWGYVLETSVRHGVAPLLDHALGRLRAVDATAASRVPADTAGELSQMRDVCRRRNERLYTTLGELVQRFTAADVCVIALKDAHLAPTVYPDPSLRPMGDVDLLVRRADWDGAASCLHDLGFEPVPPRPRRYTDRYAPGRQFRRAADETWIDLQWHIAEREWDRYGESAYAFDTDRLWDRAVPFDIGGSALFAPHPIDMLEHLCAHLEGHRYAELVLFSDVVALVERSDGFDWRPFIEQVRASRNEPTVCTALRLARSLFAADIPDEVIGELGGHVFRGGLTAPLYGNLTTLHMALDEAREAAAPPEPVERGFEVLVRAHAAAAMRAEESLVELGNALRKRAGRVVLDGDDSPRRFPDAAAPAFGRVRAIVDSATDEPIHAALERTGFVAAEADRWVKDVTFTSDDPALAGPMSLRIRAEVVRSLGRALEDRPAAPSTNAQAAIRGLALNLRHAGRNDSNEVEITIHALDHDEFVTCLADRVDRATRDRLFALASVLDGVGDAEVCPVSRRRFFTWSRYGPAALDRRPELREGYLFVLCLFAAIRARAWSYILRSIVVVLPRLFGRAAVGSIRRRRPVDHRDLAYWLRP